MNEIQYYKILNHHHEIIGSNMPLDLKELMKLVGTEIPLENYIEKIDKKYITLVKLCDFANIGDSIDPHAVALDTAKQTYRWKQLALSIKERGMIIPIIAERFMNDKGKYLYRALEGKHRVTASILIEPYNKETLIPSLVVEKCAAHIF